MAPRRLARERPPWQPACVVSDRAFDRLGAAVGVIGVVILLAALTVGGLGSSSTSGRPAPGATTQQIVAFMSRSAPATSSIGFALVLTGFFVLLVFAVRLWATLRNAEGGAAWLSTAGLAGAVVYEVADVSRFVLSEGRNLAAGHHLEPAEGVAFFDLSNALTPFAWTGIAMFTIPMSIVAVRTGALPAWLGWAGLVIGLANLVWGWLPPGGTSTPAEDAFILWVVITSVVLIRRPLVQGAKVST